MEKIIPYTIFIVGFIVLISIGFSLMRSGWKNLQQNKGYRIYNLFIFISGLLILVWTIFVLIGFIYERILNILGY
jgi:hypothetical protein